MSQIPVGGRKIQILLQNTHFSPLGSAKRETSVIAQENLSWQITKFPDY